MECAADVAETTYTPFANKPDAVPVRLIVRRVKPAPDTQLALIATYSYHAFITDREGDTLYLEADHRRHAEIENAIRDLEYGVDPNHLYSNQSPEYRDRGYHPLSSSVDAGVIADVASNGDASISATSVLSRLRRNNATIPTTSAASASSVANPAAPSA